MKKDIGLLSVNNIAIVLKQAIKQIIFLSKLLGFEKNDLLFILDEEWEISQEKRKGNLRLVKNNIKGGKEIWAERN